MTEINLKAYEEAGKEYASVSDNLNKVIGDLETLNNKLHRKVRNIVESDVCLVSADIDLDKKFIDKISEHIAIIYIVYLSAINSIEMDVGNLEDIFSNIDILSLGDKMDPKTYISFLNMLGFSSAKIREIIAQNEKLINEYINSPSTVFIGSDEVLRQLISGLGLGIYFEQSGSETNEYSISGNFTDLKLLLNATDKELDIIRQSMAIYNGENELDYNRFVEDQRLMGKFVDTFEGENLTDKEKFERIIASLENSKNSINNKIQGMSSLELQNIKLQNVLYDIERFEELAPSEIDKTSEEFKKFYENGPISGNLIPLSESTMSLILNFYDGIEDIKKDIIILEDGTAYISKDRAKMIFDELSMVSPDILDSPSTIVANSLDKYMQLNEEQVNLYNYYQVKFGQKKADEYYLALTDTLNSQKGFQEKEEFRKAMENSNVPPLTAFGEGFEDGIEGFFEGLANIFASDKIREVNDYAKIYKMQYLLELAEKEGGLENFLSNHGYKFGVTSGNITPTLLIAAASAGMGLGTMPATLAFGGSIFGNQLDYAHERNGELNFGSYAYAATYALTEVITERLLGGLPGLSNARSGIIRRMLNEANQEFVQTYLGAAQDSAYFNDEFDLSATTTEAIESALYAMLIAGVASGADSMTNRTFSFNTRDDNGNPSTVSLNYDDSVDYLSGLLESGENTSVTPSEAINPKPIGTTEGSVDGEAVDVKIYDKGSVNTDGSVDATVVNESESTGEVNSADAEVTTSENTASEVITPENTTSEATTPDVVSRGEQKAEDLSNQQSIGPEEVSRPDTTTQDVASRSDQGSTEVATPDVVSRGEQKAEDLSNQQYREPVDVTRPTNPNIDVSTPNAQTTEGTLIQPHRGPVDISIPNNTGVDVTIPNNPSTDVTLTQPYRGPVGVIIPPFPPIDLNSSIPSESVTDEELLIARRDPYLREDGVPNPSPFDRVDELDIPIPPPIDLPDDIDLPEFPTNIPDEPPKPPKKIVVVPPPPRKPGLNLIDEAILCTIVVRGIDKAMFALDNLFTNGSYDEFSVRRPTEGFNVDYIKILASYTPDEILNYLLKRIRFYYGVDFSKEDIEFIIFKYIIMLINERTSYSGNILGIDTSREIKSASMAIVNNTITKYPQVNENGELNYYLNGPIVGNILSNVTSIEEVSFSGNKFEIGNSLDFSGMSREKFSAFTRELTPNVDYVKLNNNTNLPNKEASGNIKDLKLLFPKIENDYSFSYNEVANTNTKVVRATLSTGEQVYIEDPRDLLCREYKEYITNISSEQNMLRDEKDVFSLYNGLVEVYGSENLDNYVKEAISSDAPSGRRDITEFGITIK